MCRFCNFPQKESAEFYCCTEISKIPSVEEYPYITSIKEVNIHYNSRIETIDHFSNLTILDCFCCTNLKRINIDLKNIRELNLFRSQISELPDYLPNIIIIDCASTDITELPKNVPLLEILRIDNTKIKRIPENLHSLKTLTCNDTQVLFVPKLQKITNLICSDIFVDLRYFNNIYYVNSSLLDCNKKFHILNILQLKQKIKLPFKRLIKNMTIAYDTKYLIGYFNKKKLEKIFYG